MSGTKGKLNQSCCGVVDCVEATVALLSREGMQSIVVIVDTTLTIPTSWVHESRGRTGVWCFEPDPLAPYGGEGPYIDGHGSVRPTPPKITTPQNTRCAFYLTLN